MTPDNTEPKEQQSRRISVFGGVYQSWAACPAFVPREDLQNPTHATCGLCTWRWDIFCRRVTWGWIVPPPATHTSNGPR